MRDNHLIGNHNVVDFQFWELKTRIVNEKNK